jgi:hypothetical protein
MTDVDHAGVDAVRRWEAAGGQWRVMTRSATSAVIGLFTCDGGEEMQRLTVSRADLDMLRVDLDGDDA